MLSVQLKKKKKKTQKSMRQSLKKPTLSSNITYSDRHVITHPTPFIIDEIYLPKHKLKKNYKYMKCLPQDAKDIYNIINKQWPDDLRKIYNYKRKLETNSINGICCKTENEFIGLIISEETTINRVCDWHKEYFDTDKFKFNDVKKDGNKKSFILITDLVIKKKFRNKGIASKLISLLISKQSKNTRLGLSCAYDNIAAIKTYKRAGFVQGGYNKRGYGNGKSALYFTLII